MTSLWNDAGVSLPDEPMTVDMVLQRGGLSWEVEKRPALYRDNGGEIRQIPNQYATVRADSGNALGIVGPVWAPYQNRELVEFALALRGVQGDAVVNRVATLRGGALVIAELRVGRELVVKRGGERGAMQPFLTLTMAHDGTGAIRGSEAVRVLVCSNGMVQDRNASQFSVRHTTSAAERMNAGAMLLESFQAQTLQLEATAQRLEDTEMPRRNFVEFCAQLISGKDEESEALETMGKLEGRAATLANAKFETLSDLFVHGIGNRGVTRFDALNAVTEFVDHQRGRMDSWRRTASRAQMDTALDSIAFGSGRAMKARALALLSR